MTSRKPAVAKGTRTTVGSIVVPEGFVSGSGAPETPPPPPVEAPVSDPQPEEDDSKESPPEVAEEPEEATAPPQDEPEPVDGNTIRRTEGDDGKTRDAGGNPVHGDILAGDQDIVGDRSRSADLGR